MERLRQAGDKSRIGKHASMIRKNDYSFVENDTDWMQDAVIIHSKKDSYLAERKISEIGDNKLYIQKWWVFFCQDGCKVSGSTVLILWIQTDEDECVEMVFILTAHQFSKVTLEQQLII